VTLFTRMSSLRRFTLVPEDLGNPRLYELIEHAPKTGKSPTIWAWPQIIEYLKVAGQPVQGPWPPHQEPRPDPSDESLPVAVPDPQAPPD
jgi:hypothetical protein